MKKIIILAVAFLGVNHLHAQINQAVNATQDIGQNFFYDAGSFGDIAAYGKDKGKGLIYPRTNLTNFEFKIDGAFAQGTYYSCYDGMVVYNTSTGDVNADGSSAQTKGLKVSVTPGFYYFSNPNINGEDDVCSVSNGKWVRIADTSDLDSGVTNGKFWTLNGNSNTQPATIDASNTIIGGNFIGTTDEKSLTIGTNNIARLNIGAIPETVDGKQFDFVLRVYGKAKFDKGIVTQASTYPDYVFDNYFTGKSEENPNYEFKSLSEVESFIKENNHLPGVTSIKELTKSGEGYNVDNTQMAIQTLEKVEELYLHIIEQQKEIKALKAEIAELKK